MGIHKLYSIGVLYALLGSLFVGLHVYSIRYIDNFKHPSLVFIMYILFSFSLWLMSRYFVYNANKSVDIVLIHAILTCSLLATMVMSFIFHSEEYNKLNMTIGVLLTIAGILFINSSIKK
jgi:multidrug transporter EmrE-like cation transporter